MKMRKIQLLAFLGLVACGSEPSNLTHEASGGGSGGDGATLIQGGQGGGTGGGGIAGEGGSGGSTGGSTAQGGQGGSIEPICTPSDTQCDGLDVQTCNQDGSAWDVTETCPFLCDQGACTGVCSPADTQCSGLDAQTCDGAGQWQTTQTCPFVCQAGACSGVCVPNDTKCNGVIPQTCSAQGQWVDGSACPFVCTSGACTGACTPNDLECNGSVLEVCNQNGAWQTSQNCSYVCIADACTGLCVPNATQCSGNVIDTCDANGQWQSGAPCPFVCQAGACAGICVPGTVECDGTGTKTCNLQGQWDATVPCPGDVNADPTCSGNGICGWTCQSGFDDCTGQPGCESDLSNPATCGSCSNTCNSTGGTATCSNGNCGIICDGTHADCSGGVADGCETTLGTTTDCLSCNDACSSPAHAAGICTGAGCDYVCDSLWDDCVNGAVDGCEKDVSADDWNCGGCDVSCHGGTCVNGVCDTGITKVADATDVTSIALGTVYGHQDVYWTEADGDVQKTPAAGGSSTLMSSGENDPQAAVTDGTRIIWSNTEQFTAAIRAVPVGGGSVQDLVTGYGPLELTHDGVNLFWNDQTSYEPCYCSLASQTNIWKMGLGGGPPQILNTDAKAWPSWPGVVVDSANAYRLRWKSTSAISDIYWHDKNNPVFRGSMAGGLFINSVWQGYVAGKYLAISPSGVMVLAATFTLAGPGIMKVDGGTPEVLALIGNVEGLAVDDQFVYVLWRRTFNISQIKKYPLAGGNATILADYQYNAKHIRVDATHVYWATEGYEWVGGSVPDVVDKVILRVPK